MMIKEKHRISRALFQDTSVTPDQRQKEHQQLMDTLFAQQEEYISQRYQILSVISPTSPPTQTTHLTSSTCDEASHMSTVKKAKTSCSSCIIKKSHHHSSNHLYHPPTSDELHYKGIFGSGYLAFVIWQILLWSKLAR